MNSNLILKLCCLLWILNAGCIFSQDTIFFKDKRQLIVLVKEVSPKTIQYKKAELPDGPMYIIEKNEVEKITYKNGYSETIKAESDVVESTRPAVEYGNTYTVTREKITYYDTKTRPRHLIELIDRHPDAGRKQALLEIQKSMRGLKVGQDVSRTVAIVCGGITIGTGIFAGFVYLIDSYAGETVAVVPLSFGVAALVTTATAVSFNINLKKKRHAFVDLYNQ